MTPINEKLWNTLGQLRGKLKLKITNPEDLQELLETLDKVEEALHENQESRGYSSKPPTNPNKGNKIKNNGQRPTLEGNYYEKDRNER